MFVSDYSRPLCEETFEYEGIRVTGSDLVMPFTNRDMKQAGKG